MREIDTIGMLGQDSALEMSTADGRGFEVSNRKAKHRHILGGVNRPPLEAASNMGFSAMPGVKSDS